MANVDDYILGDRRLHDRLCIAAGILAELVRRAPRALSVARLEQATGYASCQLDKLCHSLAQAGMLQPDAQGLWMLACAPDDITLADVFRWVLAELTLHGQQAAPPDEPQRIPHEVDLLVMQATVGINQSVLSHLRQFSLDRLKISSSGMSPRSRKMLCHGFDDAALELGVPQTCLAQ